MKPYRGAQLLVLSTLLATGACSSDNMTSPPPGGTGTADAGGGADAGGSVVDASAGEAAASDATGSEAAPGDNGVIQAAINAAVSDGGTTRVYILVPPGIYREVVCVPPGAPPITLYSTNPDPTKTVIVFNNYNGEGKAATVVANLCTPNNSPTSTTNTTFGTAGSATFSAFARGFQAKNVTFSNDTSNATLGATTGSQAVALMTEADQVILENVQVLGHQDTLYAETPSSDTVVRDYIKSSYIQGDVDFIFGGATLVVDSSQIEFVSDRKPKGGQALSPSTDSRNAFGELVNGGSFTGDTNTLAGSFALGRAWDRSCVDIPYYTSTCIAAGHYPNGQAVVRGASLDAHVAAAPWLPSATTARPFCDEDWACLADAGTLCPANRLFEYQNAGPGSAPAAVPTDAAETPACSNKRPQLTDAEAAGDAVLTYLAQAGSLTAGLTTDNWDPRAGVGDVSTFVPTITVAAPSP
jgi:pectinesterase